MKKAKLNTIKVNKESYMYLQKRHYTERIGKDLNEKALRRYERSFDNFQYNGYKELYDGDLGGAINGKWTSWSCNDMKSILDEQGLSYIVGEVKECILF